MQIKLNNEGFSLIELLIVIAIIGIIAAFAYPSYQESVAKSRRADAQGALIGLSSALERFYSEGFTYGGAAEGKKNTGAPLPALYPSQAPLDGGTKYYNLRITSSTTNSFTIQAQPIGAMVGDRCGNLQLTSTGVRTAAVGEDDCWR
ncbi:type IV pilin protein [Hahella sp. HN01]|uniref:type IV pilin protein n=1 Tax=Hahella sp. HN01 TaxID=2847262 RepID=UPI001C1F1D43|nr:type IV pilin protein [Hahella sp. HN01]MBU6955316.1 prepilin-type N-terminal cleavage/methylation domain-containing protein [Hahella sp. HN01]